MIPEPERPEIEIRLPNGNGEPPETQLAVRVLADALSGESVAWAAEHPDGWDVLERLAQLPGTRVLIAFPSGGGVVHSSDQAKAEAILATADKEKRGLSSAEKMAIKELVERATLSKSVEDLGRTLATPVGSDRAGAFGPGDVFVASEGHRQLIDGGIPGGDWRTGEIEYLGAAGDPVLESTGSNADAIAQQVVPGALKDPGLRQERLTLADLFAQGTATGGVIRYMKATTRNAPTDTATDEGQDKPGAEFAFDDATAELAKLAAFIPVSEEMLEDAPAVRSYINTISR